MMHTLMMNLKSCSDVFTPPEVLAAKLKKVCSRIKDRQTAEQLVPEHILILARAGELVASAVQAERHLNPQLDIIRRLAIVGHVRLTDEGRTIPNGFSCKLCEAECGPDAQLVHSKFCPAG